MNFFKKIIEKFTSKKEISTYKGKTQQELQEEKSNIEQAPVSEKRVVEKTDEEIVAELNMLAPGIFSQAKTPEAKNLIIKIYRKMVEDGVDLKNEKEVERWMRQNQHLFASQMPKVETYRRENPKVGRNDPCPCGSGKKYKKCCGLK
ncbi:MAG: SEC-C metal-binding domain-containing protein [Elusimicrobiales bacterium]